MKILSNLSVSGLLGLNSVSDANTDTDKFLVLDSSGIVRYRTGAELYNDIGAGGAAAYTSVLQHEVKAAVAINKGQAVYVSSADGTNMIVSKASNASEATSSKTLGLLAQNLAINGKGFVVTEGLLAGIDTSAANTEGDPVWLGTDGNLIFGLASKPYAPDHLVFIGIVTRKNANNGEIFVKVQNGFELQELHNVQITSTPSDNSTLSYEASTGLYKMKSVPTLLGYTPANAARTLTINGTAYDLSADRIWNVGTTTGSGSAGQVAYWNGSTSQTGSNNLFWDTTNNRLGIGLVNPQRRLEIYSATADSHLRLSGSAPSVSLGEAITGSIYQAKFGLATANGQYSSSAAAGDFVIISQTGATIWVTGTTDKLKLFYGGNFVVGGGTDSSLARLQVVGGIQQSNVTSSVLKVDSNGVIIAAVSGTDYLAPSALSGYATQSWVTSQGYLTGITSIQVTTALGYTPYNSTNPNGYISSYTETSTLANVTARGASTSTAITLNTGGNIVSTSTWEKWRLVTTGVTAPARMGSDGNGLNFTSNAVWSPGWVQDDSTKKSMAYIQHLGNGRHEFRTSPSGGTVTWTTGLTIDEAGANFNVPLTISSNTVYHAGNLTNLSQLTNGPGYITSSALSGYATQSWVTSQGYLTSVTNISGYSYNLYSQDVRTISPSSHGSYRLNFGFTSWANNNTSPYADYIHLRSYSDGSGGADNLIMFLKSGIGMRIWQQSFGSASAYSSYADVLHSSNYNSYSPTLTGGGASGTWGINITGSAGSAGQVTHNSGRTDSAYYNVGWFAGSPSPAYSCDAVQIQSSTGTLKANNFVSNQIVVAYGNVTDTTNGSTWYGLGNAGNIHGNGANAIQLGGYFGVRIKTSSTIMDFYQGSAYYNATFNSAVLQQAGNQVLHAANYSSYALPLGGGTMSGKIFTVSTGTGTYDTAIEIRETGYATTSQSGWGYSPAMTFHWGGRYAKRFGMRSDGLFAIDDEPIALRSWVTSLGYITGYTETDTLASVTGRGASTSTNVTFNGTLTSAGQTILAGAFRFYTGGSDGGTSYGDFRTNPATGNSIISAKSNALYFNYDHGTGGVIFCNGASGIVGTVDAAGIATFNASTRSPIFYDSENTGYYGDFASTSNFNVVQAYSYQGNANVAGTGSASYHPSGIYSTGTNWLYGTMYMNGNDIYDINGARAYYFYDRSDTGYYTRPSAISRMYGIAIRGDNNSTGTDNQIFFWGAGNSTTSAIGFKANGGYFTNPTGFGDGYNTYLTMDSDGRGWVFRRGVGGSDFGAAYTSGWILNNGVWQANASMRAPIFYDSNDTSFYLDPNSYSRLNRVGVGGAANDVSGININGDAGITSSNFLYFGHSNGSLGSWQTRTYASGGRQIWNTNGFEVNRDGYGGGLIIYSDSSARVGFATSDFSYTASDNTPVTGSITNNRVFVNGSIQLLGNNDAITFGRGTATFLKDEELGFGWGGGWYMEESAYIRSRNSKSLHMNSGSIDYTGSIYINSGPGVHLQGNSSGSYGSLQITQSKNGWSGIYFTASGNHLMANGNEVGQYQYAVGWKYRWYQGTMYVSRGTTGGGTEYTVLDSGNYTSWAQPRIYQGISTSGDFQTFQSSEGVRFDQVNYTPGLSNPPGGYTYGGVLSMRGANFGFQLWGSHTGDLFYKTQWSNDQYSGWRGIITSLNIGSQSVNYAATSGNTNSISSAVGGSYTWTNYNYFRTNNGGYLGSLSQAALQVYSDSNNSAYMSFHKGGYYAVNMGLDADNWFRIGGWSASSNRLQMDMSGNLYMAGDVTAYSDARVKENVVTVDNALNKVQKLRGVYYNRTDSDDKRRKVGVIAQEILEVIPEVVGKDNDGMYNVSYGNIVGVLIEAMKEQQKQIENLKGQLNGITK